MGVACDGGIERAKEGLLLKFLKVPDKASIPPLRVL